jgi:porin
VFDQRVYAETSNESDGQGAFVMASFGLADDDVSPVARHVAVGAYFVGPIPGRDRDTSGLLVSHVEVSDKPGSGATQDETAFELFHRVRVTSHLFIQPVLQYIRHPAAVSGVSKALVGTLRFELRW